MAHINHRLIATLFVAAGIAAVAMTAPPPPPAPPVSIGLVSREGRCTPARRGYTHTAGGNIDVQQPAPDTLVISLTGAVVAGLHPLHNSSAEMCFDVAQTIEISFDDPKVKRARLSIEGRLIGLLRSSKGSGTAGVCDATATVSGAGADLLTISAPNHSAADGVNLSINDLITCQTTPVSAGQLTIHQTLTLSATHPRGLCPARPTAAEFAPESAMDPQWIAYWEPFRGAVKKDFGFQVVVRVADDSGSSMPISPMTVQRSKSK